MYLNISKYIYMYVSKYIYMYLSYYHIIFKVFKEMNIYLMSVSARLMLK